MEGEDQFGYIGGGMGFGWKCLCSGDKVTNSTRGLESFIGLHSFRGLLGEWE